MNAQRVLTLLYAVVAMSAIVIATAATPADTPSGVAALELVKEAGESKLLRLPPSAAAHDALLAHKDGKAAGRWFLSMISDGDFSKEEQEQIGTILPGYYGLRIHWRKLKAGVTHSYRGDYAYTTVEALKELAEYFPQKGALKPERIEFWAKPSRKVEVAAATRARNAVRRIGAKIMALKRAAYPELDRFGLDSIHLSDSGFWYAPNKPEKHDKFGKPIIGMTIGTPCLVMTQISFPRVIFPRQCLEVRRVVRVGGRGLNDRIKQIIESEIGPLIAAERSLGGEPIYDGW